MNGHPRADRQTAGEVFLVVGFGLMLALVISAWDAGASSAESVEEWDGKRIMREVFARHELFPYVFEEQTMIMMDRSGNRNVRKVRRFTRLEKDETARFLMVFDYPPEIRGVALLAVRQSSGQVDSGIYLPAYGNELISNVEEEKGGRFLGTDFAIQDLTAEILADYRYSRVADQTVENAACFVVEAFPGDQKVEMETGYSLRRLFIRQDIFFVIRTDYYDRRLRFYKIQTRRDLKQVDGDMWRANMILMESRKERHQTLIKIDRRVFSHDYVPPEIFTRAWLRENMPAHHENGVGQEADNRALLEKEDGLPALLEDEKGTVIFQKKILDGG